MSPLHELMSSVETPSGTPVSTLLTPLRPEVCMAIEDELRAALVARAEDLLQAALWCISGRERP